MRKLVAIAPLLLAITAACAPVESAADKAGMSAKDNALLAERLKGRIAGKSEKCVPLGRLGQPVVYGRQTIIYSGSGRTEYLNNLPSPCPGLDDDDYIVTKTSGSQLCEGDPIEPVDRFSGFSGPICRLGAFIPYTKPEKRD